MPAARVSTLRRSPTVAKYSVRLRRRKGERPGLLGAIAHSGVTNCAAPESGAPDEPWAPDEPGAPGEPDTLVVAGSAPTPMDPVHAPIPLPAAARPSFNSKTDVRRLHVLPNRKGLTSI
jgi:hypothetical protein